MSDTYDSVCNYFGDVYYSPQSLIERFDDVRSSFMSNEVDTLVGTGLSGGIIVPMLARAYDMDYMIVRKNGTNTHDSSMLFGRMGRRYAIVDDFVASGATVKRIQRELFNWVPKYHKYELDGIWEFENDQYSDFTVMAESKGWVWRPRQVSFTKVCRIESLENEFSVTMLREEHTGKLYAAFRGLRTPTFTDTQEVLAKDDERSFTIIYKASYSILNADADDFGVSALEAKAILQKSSEKVAEYWSTLEEALDRLKRVISTSE